MLEILALRYLCNKISILAIKKGFKKGKWQLLVALFWFACELACVFIFHFVLGEDVLTGVAFGYLMAYISYRVIKWKLGTYPDKQDDWIDNIGVEEAIA